jgi:legumain
MFLRQSIILIASITLLNAIGTLAGNGQNWAVLVAGSNGWYNYRHQSDVCHAYQILHKNGIPDSNIIVMMYDDLAKNTENPTKGIIINHPNGQDVYKGVPHDYIGKTVTPKNFIDVLLGKKDAMKGVGSGKVLESGPDDNVFIYFTDHGATGLVAFPNGVLYAKDFIATIKKMNQEKKYGEMVIYIEACESGSMLEGLLPDNINIYATTASNAEESSYACYYDEKRQTYLGDLYSVNWMEDSDAEDITTESLFKQFEVTKRRTNLSHVMQYGNLELGKEHNVSEFQGENKKNKPKPVTILFNQVNAILKRDAVATVDVRESIVSRRLAALPSNSAERVSLETQYAALRQQRQLIASTIDLIAKHSFEVNGINYYEKVTTQRMKLTQHDCYISATQRLHEKCFDIQNEYVLNKLWIVANLCEVGLQDFTINNAIDNVCGTLGRQYFY